MAVHITNDPGAAHPAKNVAAPGLPNHRGTDSKGRTSMVGPMTGAPGDEFARLTADVVLLARREDGELCVLLVRRGWEPFKGKWALPGGHVDPGETTFDAAVRELAEETGIRVAGLDAIGVYATPGRDPRGRYVTFAYTATVWGPMPEAAAGDDAVDARWWTVDEALYSSEEIAFDHALIIADGLRTGTW